MAQEEIKTYAAFRDRYRYDPSDLKARLGVGGFGEVYKAYDQKRDLWFAVKVAPSAGAVSLSEEVKRVKELPEHTNIACYECCYTFSTTEGQRDFGILQYYAEGDLLNLLKNRKLDPEQKQSILLQILTGLGFLHHHHIIHRDLKPANILIAKRPSGDQYIYIPKITDFGISKKLDDENNNVCSAPTQAGVATWFYASPEQITGKKVRNPNTDLWSFGVLAFLTLSGKLPFNSGEYPTNSEAGRIELYKQITEGCLSEAINQVCEPWQTLIRRCLVPDQNQRIQSVLECFKVLGEDLPPELNNDCVQDDDVEKTVVISDRSRLPGNPSEERCRIDNGSTQGEGTVLISSTSPPTPPPSQSKRSVIWAVSGACVVFCVALLALWYFGIFPLRNGESTEGKLESAPESSPDVVTPETVDISNRTKNIEVNPKTVEQPSGPKPSPTTVTTEVADPPSNSKPPVPEEPGDTSNDTVVPQWVHDYDQKMDMANDYYERKRYAEAQQAYEEGLRTIPSSEGNDMRALVQQKIQACQTERRQVLNGINSSMKPVRGGTFKMGCTTQKNNCSTNEKPDHDVTLSDFYISVTEVTMAQFYTLMSDSPSGSNDADLPVAGISWEQAMKFIQQLNAWMNENNLPANYRLPTEAEWEYAARGGNKSQHWDYSGGNDIEDVAWYRVNSGGSAHPVSENEKKKKTNELGLYSMSGNVAEWCSDWFGEYNKNKQTDPPGRSSGVVRVVRGGSWQDDAKGVRISRRDSQDPGLKSQDIGFRLARSN